MALSPGTPGELAAEPCDHGNTKGKGFTRARLSSTQHILAGKGVGKSVDLDGKGGINSSPGEGCHNAGGHAKLRKSMRVHRCGAFW